MKYKSIQLKLCTKNLTDSHSCLTENERQLLKFICTDFADVEIVEKMFLSPKTIDGYRDTLYKKLNVSTRVQLALYTGKTGKYYL